MTQEGPEETAPAIEVAAAPPAIGETEKTSVMKDVDVDDDDDDDKDVEDQLKKPALPGGAIDTDASAADPTKTMFPMREVSIPLCWGGKDGAPRPTIRFNPFAAFFATCLLWGLSIWCMVNPDSAKTSLTQAKSQVTLLFTWFYVGTNPAFMFFMIWLAFRFGHVRLGPQDSKPEFTDVTYFAMLFSAGIGVGLFFYGVAEPLWHQKDHWFANAGYHNQDEIDMWALNLTVFHWGITGWSQYLVLAVCMGLASYHFNLPLTLRSCFYPLLGEYTWGWIGDLVDGYCIVTTVAGVCTSLGLGAFQIAAGLERVGAVDANLTESQVLTVQIVSIWVITLIATASVVSGIGVGIKYLSQFGFGLGMLLLFLVFVLDKTEYLLNLIVQEVGFYFQWSILQLNFWTDAFGQLKEGEGRAVDGLAAATSWMNDWTIFYIGWWVAWAAFVGLFIARISWGRTIASVVMWSYLCPLAYTILWFGVFGGVGLRQARQAEEMKVLGGIYYNNTDKFLHKGSTYCYDVPQQDVVVTEEGENKTIFTSTLPGVTPVCVFNSTDSDNAWFNVMFSYTFPNDFNIGFGYFLAWLSIFALAIYFVTSSDSGSLIVDQLASNGREDTHFIQRIFWAFTEGAVATALLVAGGADALRALQAASILSGLPFTLFLIFMCMAILKMCQLSEKNVKDGTDVTLQDEYEKMGKFAMPVQAGILNVFEYIISFGMVHEQRVSRGMDLPTKFQVVEFFKALFFPFIPLYKIYSQLYAKPNEKKANIIMTAIYTLMFLLWIALFASMTVSYGFAAFAWSAFFINGCIMTNLRSSVRGRFNIVGNLIADFFFGSFFYPQVLTQMLLEFQVRQDSDKDIDA